MNKMRKEIVKQDILSSMPELEENIPFFGRSCIFTTTSAS